MDSTAAPEFVALITVEMANWFDDVERFVGREIRGTGALVFDAEHTPDFDDFESAGIAYVSTWTPHLGAKTRRIITARANERADCGGKGLWQPYEMSAYLPATAEEVEMVHNWMDEEDFAAIVRPLVAS